MTIDVGTGDGRAVLAAAVRQPTTLVLGIDANASAMAEASRRAAAPARKGGLGNALFVAAAVEAVPPELFGHASLVTVRFPWGSLLRGCLGLDDAVADGLSRLVAPRGRLELLLAPADRDGLPGIPTTETGLIDAATRAFARHDFRVRDARAATPAEIAATGSSWARRLGVAGRGNGSPARRSNGSGRTPVLVRLERR